MSRSPMIVRTIPALRRAIDGISAKRFTTALVPTMGALHDGHLSLVRLAKRRAPKVVVSIFVNPTQFAPAEDFGSYPRTWKADLAKLAAERVELIWHPDVKTVYAEGFSTRIACRNRTVLRHRRPPGGIAAQCRGAAVRMGTAAHRHPIGAVIARAIR